MKQRCENREDAGWGNYGERGIEFRFNSVTEAGLWVMENIGLERNKELDRIDNNGHYEPGNLRWATHSQNNSNKRTSVVTHRDLQWAKTQTPYSYLTTCRKLRQGMSRQEIVDQAQTAVAEKRKNWRGIQASLEKLGYST